LLGSLDTLQKYYTMSGTSTPVLEKLGRRKYDYWWNNLDFINLPSEI